MNTRTMIPGMLLVVIGLFTFNQTGRADPPKPDSLGSEEITNAQKKCDQGVMEACAFLGTSYLEGKAVAKDKKRAVTLFEKACQAKNTSACEILGTMLIQGEGVAKNAERGVALLESTCASKSANSCMVVGMGYMQGDLGFAKDAVKGCLFLEKACDLESLESCNYLATYIIAGTCGPTDLARAEKILRKTCDKNSADGCARLGVVLFKLEKEDEGMVFFKKACTQGHTISCKTIEKLSASP